MQVKAFTWLVVLQVHCQVLLRAIFISAKDPNSISDADIKLVVIELYGL